MCSCCPISFPQPSASMVNKILDYKNHSRVLYVCTSPNQLQKNLHFFFLNCLRLLVASNHATGRWFLGKGWTLYHKKSKRSFDSVRRSILAGKYNLTYGTHLTYGCSTSAVIGCPAQSPSCPNKHSDWLSVSDFHRQWKCDVVETLLTQSGLVIYSISNFSHLALVFTFSVRMYSYKCSRKWGSLCSLKPTETINIIGVPLSVSPSYKYDFHIGYFSQEGLWIPVIHIIFCCLLLS